MYAYNPKGFLILCSSLIEDCNECENYQNCLNCKDGSGLTNNNKCISESIVVQLLKIAFLVLRVRYVYLVKMDIKLIVIIFVKK